MRAAPLSDRLASAGELSCITHREDAKNVNHSETADRIAALLELELPPVALAFVDEAPDGVESTDAVVPSACAFWRRAEEGVFYAPAEAHFNCPVGAMVMGFDLPEPVQANLGA